VGLGATYDVHLRLIGKRVMDLLLVFIRGVATGWTGVDMFLAKVGWTCPPYFCQRPFLRLMQIRRVFFFWGGEGVANVHVQQQPGCKCFFFAVLPVHLLAVHQ